MGTNDANARQATQAHNKGTAHGDLCNRAQKAATRGARCMVCCTGRDTQVRMRSCAEEGTQENSAYLCALHEVILGPWATPLS